MDIATDRIWVECDRYHTAIVIATQVVRESATELMPVLNQQSLVRFGWGDRDYYGSPQKNLYKMLKALFLPTRSVMEVSAFDRLTDVGDTIIPVSLQELDIHKLLAFISGSFAWNQAGLLTLERTEANGFRYYRGRGIYHMFKNCNNWTAKALQLSGLPVHHALAFFGNSVMKQLR